ncbi:MAG: carboxymuconolactone decarboxylase family protein [Luteimonas sp.]
MTDNLNTEARLNFFAFGPDAMRAMSALDTRVAQSDLELRLIELVRLRVSQINGCAFCVDKHASDALKSGEDPRRLLTLQVWRDVPFFSAKERAALEWAEALTRIADAHVSDEIWERVQQKFVPSKLVDLTLAINAVNAWNRFAIAFRKLPS